MEPRMYKILEVIVDEYIKTGLPVGSAGIKSKLSFSVSPATIRAEMAKLEHQGYLDHPHTSAGRIPTIKGYRTYIDAMSLGSGALLPLSERERINSVLSAVSDKDDSVIVESASEVLSDITKCAVISARSTDRFSVISKVEVIPAGRRMYVLLIVTSEGDIKNRVCRLSFDISHEQIEFFVNFLNKSLTGLNLTKLSKDYVENLAVALGNYVMTLSPLLSAVAELSSEVRTKNVVIKGAGNLIDCDDLPKNEIVSIIEQRNSFTALLDDAFSGIHVVFGGEKAGGSGGNVESGFAVSNGSLISGSFRKGQNKAGSLAAIGPLRLDYKKIIPYMEYFTDKITELLTRDEADDDENI